MFGLTTFEDLLKRLPKRCGWLGCRSLMYFNSFNSMLEICKSVWAFNSQTNKLNCCLLKCVRVTFLQNATRMFYFRSTALFGKNLNLILSI